MIPNYANSSFEERKLNHSLPLEKLGSLRESLAKLRASASDPLLGEVEIDEAVKKHGDVVMREGPIGIKPRLP